MQKLEIKPGLYYFPEALDRAQQEKLLSAIRGVVSSAPPFTPTMPGSGKPMSVQLTNCGKLGWVSDRKDGYRYQKTHPVTQEYWPEMPIPFLQQWQNFSAHPGQPDCGLVNYYSHSASMGLHVDRDELDFTAPVVSVSLGDQANFVIGGLARKDSTRSLKLSSGDVIVIGGAMRLVHHGISRLCPGSSSLVEEGGRFNITLRKAR